MAFANPALHSGLLRLRHPFSLLVLYGVIAGASFSIIKIAIGAGVPPLGLVAWQFIGAAAVMLTVGFLRRELPAFSPRNFGFYTVSGLPCLALPMTCMFLALEHLPAGVVGLIVSTMPILTYLLALSIGSEKWRWLRVGGIACGFAGTVLILAPGGAFGGSGPAGWVLVAFISPLMYAIGSLYTGARRPAGATALTLTTGMLVVAAVAMVPISMATGQFYVPRLAGPGVGESMILIQIAVASLNYLMFFEIIRRAGPVYFSQIGYLVTLTAMFWAVLLFAERYGSGIWAATVLVFAGIALINATSVPGRRRAA